MVTKEERKFVPLLFPDAMWIFECLEEGTLPKNIIFSGPFGCGQQILAEYIAKFLELSFQVVNSGTIKKNSATSFVVDKLPSLYFVTMLDEHREIVEHFLPSFRDNHVILSFANETPTPLVTAVCSPLSLKQTAIFLRTMSDEVLQWKSDKNTAKDIYEYTMGCQTLLHDFCMMTVKKKTTSAVLEVITVSSSKAHALYETIINNEKPVEEVMTAVREAISSESFHILGKYIKAALRHDILSGPASHVTSGGHRLLALDLESSLDLFVYGCLEIAITLRN